MEGAAEELAMKINQKKNPKIPKQELDNGRRGFGDENQREKTLKREKKRRKTEKEREKDREGERERERWGGQRGTNGSRSRQRVSSGFREENKERVLDTQNGDSNSIHRDPRFSSKTLTRG